MFETNLRILFTRLYSNQSFKILQMNVYHPRLIYFYSNFYFSIFVFRNFFIWLKYFEYWNLLFKYNSCYLWNKNVKFSFKILTRISRYLLLIMHRLGILKYLSLAQNYIIIIFLNWFLLFYRKLRPKLEYWRVHIILRNAFIKWFSNLNYINFFGFSLLIKI